VPVQLAQLLGGTTLGIVVLAALVIGVVPDGPAPSWVRQWSPFAAVLVGVLCGWLYVAGTDRGGTVGTVAMTGAVLMPAGAGFAILGAIGKLDEWGVVIGVDFLVAMGAGLVVSWLARTERLHVPRFPARRPDSR
jgi:hypothetical protein